MAVNLKALSAIELEALIQDASAHLEGARKNLLHDVRARIDAILHESGLTLDEVYHRRAGKKANVSTRRSTLKGQTVAPKYRNPADASETWTGRGRQPRWMVEALKKRGVTLDSLLIAGNRAATKKSAKKATKKATKKAVKKTVRRKAKA